MATHGNSIREALEAAYSESETEENDDAVQEEAEVGEAVEDIAEEAVDATSEAAEEPEQAEAAEEVAEAAEEAAEPVEVEYDGPSSWKKEYQEKWGAIDPEVRSYIMERENQMHHGIGLYKKKAEQMAESATLGSAMQKAVAPYEAMIRAENSTPEKAVSALLNTAYQLRNADQATKANLLHGLAQQYGVDLGSLQNPPEVDPQVAELRGQLAQMQSYLAQQRQAQQQAEQQTLTGQISAFQEAGHEHFETLRPQMADLLEKGLATDLEDAYNKALRLNDELFNAQVAEQQRARQIEEKRKADEAAKQAKASAVSVRGSTSKVGSDKSGGSIREELEKAVAGARL